MAARRTFKVRKTIWPFVAVAVLAFIAVGGWLVMQVVTSSAGPSAGVEPETSESADAGTAEALLAGWRKQMKSDPADAVYIGLGDSTRDGSTAGPSPFYYDALRAELPLPPENVISMGVNGASLLWLLDQDDWDAQIEQKIEGRAALVDLSALTNDVRTGTLGTTRDEIATNGAALLQRAVDLLQMLPSEPVIKLTVPAPYLAEGEWITGVDPLVASEGVRAAYLAVAADNPDVILQDAQAELFGFTTDRPMDGDQLHPGVQAQKALAEKVAALIS